MTFCNYRSSNSLRRQTVRQGSSTNQSHVASNSASGSATLDMQVFRRVNRGTCTKRFTFTGSKLF